MNRRHVDIIGDAEFKHRTVEVYCQMNEAA
jgi:hypothetical protein